MYSLWDVDPTLPLPVHPLNVGRVAWWLTLPTRFGGPIWWDLVKGLQGQLTGFTAGYGWSPQSNQGGAGSISFNGTSSYIPVALDLSAYYQLTIGVSFYQSAWNDNDDMLCEFTPNTNTNPGAFFIDPNSGAPDTGYFQVSTNGGGGYNSVYCNRPTAGAWHRGVIGINLHLNPCVQYIFFDGQNYSLTATSGNNAPTGTQNFANSTLYFGCRDGGSYFYPGSINDFSLWAGTLLNESEIVLDYQLSQQGYPGVLPRRSSKAWFLPSSNGIPARLRASCSASATLAPYLLTRAQLQAQALSYASPATALNSPGILQAQGESAAELVPTPKWFAAPQVRAAANALVAPSLHMAGILQADGNASASLLSRMYAGVELQVNGEADAVLIGSVSTGRVLATLAADGICAASVAASGMYSALLLADGKPLATVAPFLSSQALLAAHAQTVALLSPSFAPVVVIRAEGSGTALLDPSAKLYAAPLVQGIAAASLVPHAIFSASLRAAGEANASLLPILGAPVFARLVANGVANVTVYAVAASVGAPDFIFVEPARSLVFVEPARSLVFSTS